MRIVDAKSCSGDAIDHAAELLAGGCIVAFPTDTVYGVAADPCSAQGVERIFSAKGRPRSMPLPILAAGMDQLLDCGFVFSEQARRLCEELWPGALTLILRFPNLPWDLGDAPGTVAVRVPDHALALELLTKTGPLAVTSANISGHDAALTAQEAARQLGDWVALYLDGGPAPGGTASTIIDLAVEEPAVLRPGPLDEMRLEALLGHVRTVSPEAGL